MPGSPCCGSSNTWSSSAAVTVCRGMALVVALDGGVRAYSSGLYVPGRYTGVLDVEGDAGSGGNSGSSRKPSPRKRNAWSPYVIAEPPYGTVPEVTCPCSRGKAQRN